MQNWILLIYPIYLSIWEIYLVTLMSSSTNTTISTTYLDMQKVSADLTDKLLEYI